LSDAFMATGAWFQTTFGPAFVAVWNAIATALPAVWAGIRMGFVSFANGMIMGFNGMIVSYTKGAELLANGVIAGINGIISAYNRLASALKLPDLPSLSYLSLSAPQIPLIAAANGFNGDVNGPHLFLAGEAGQEHVSITPNGGSSKGNNGPTVINYITVQGSIKSSQELAKDVDKVMKDTLKRHGWA
jgi:hypothetical protein